MGKVATKQTDNGKSDVVINKKADGTVEKKGNSILEAMIEKDCKTVNMLLNKIGKSSDTIWKNWMEVGEYLVKWKKASTSYNDYGKFLQKYCPDLDSKIVNYVWKAKQYESIINLFRADMCPTICHPRTVWTRWYASIEDMVFRSKVDEVTGTRQVTKEAVQKQAEKNKAAKAAKTAKTTETVDIKDKPAEKEQNVTAKTLTGAKDFVDRLKGYSMALNALIIDANSGVFKGEQKSDIIKRLETVLKILKS